MASTALLAFLAFIFVAPLAAQVSSKPGREVGRVCVTGAAGYVATELVKQLLDNGYRVHATVRSLDSKVKWQHQHLLDYAKTATGALVLLEADLLKEGSFDACASRAKYLFHTASPFHFEAKDARKDMMAPAVNGTENVLRSAALKRVKRVILTSSFAAQSSFLQQDKPDSGSLYTEGDWNDFVDEEVWENNSQQAYIASKSLAERKAWEMAKKLELDLVVINPVLVMGPVMSRRVEGTSVGLMKGVIEGTPIPMSFPWCDVRDVARAHIKAAENPEASGRYIVAHPDRIPYSDVYDILTKAFPELEFAKPIEVADPVPMIDNTKIKSLLSYLYPLEQTIIDMARSLIAAKLARPVEKGSSSKEPLNEEL
eukprot:CAMPEP_0197629634 /NCGR_PEP_ID=MMETSP1338-20131121/7404_1 /TAXON_ID=43686 ORGANISM="Pelagodinium beii, Strain RCC1491" /NCGR_SAMPLE_ID=MMETSP1338 /ASSEMBLY_ACC=CAM_ASM_000754 /LENGTH=369 /DNA_ID=CAMNT_0043200707 /DNA_START=70 /DNA_END=1179 /DNA_ORIENTATION=+